MNLLRCMLHPVTIYAFIAVGLALCLYLFVSLKAEIRALTRRCLDDRAKIENLVTTLGEARDSMQLLQSNLKDVEQQTGMLVPPAPVRSGFNLSKRTQVLRMHRSGQDCAGIAAALDLPRSEVALLIKVHRIVIEQI